MTSRDEKNLLKILKAVLEDIDRIDRVLVELVKEMRASKRVEFEAIPSSSLTSSRDSVLNDYYERVLKLDKLRIKKGSYKLYVC